MKRISHLFTFIFIFSLFFIISTNVEATDKWKRVTSWPGNINIDERDEMYHFTKKSFDFYYKRDTRNGELQVFCVSGNAVPVRTSYNCTTGNQFSNNIRVAIGAMMKNYTSISDGWLDKNDSPNDNITLIDKYWYLQIAIDNFLTGKGETLSFSTTPPTGGNIDKIKAIGDSIYSVYNNIDDKKISIDSLGNLKGPNSSNLYYTDYANYSVNFTSDTNATAASNYLDHEDSCTVNNSNVSCNTSGEKVRITFSKNDLDSLLGKEITLRVKRKYSFDINVNYSCGDGYQLLTPLVTMVNNKSVSGVQTIKIPKNPVTVSIGKTDKDRKYISGAVLKITGPSYSNQITTGTSATPLTLTEPGTYTVTEITAPDGYALNSTPITFTVSADKLLTGGNLGTFNITNNLIQTKFQKIDAVTKKNVPGAILQVLDDNKNPIKDYSDKVMHVFTTLDTDYTIEGLKAGTYYLKEISAPSGYKVNDNLLKFSIDASGKNYVYNESKKTFEEVVTIKFENYPNIKVNFSKQDATTGKELPGATLELLDKDKKSILDESGKKKYEWVSTDTPHLIEDLDPGNYCLKETIAPKGYTRTEELVCFTLSYDKLENEVVMKNSPIVEVPNTSKSASIPIIIASIVLLISGVSIVGYIIYKSKKTS